MKHLLTSTFRHLLNNKIHALINLFGLSLGLTVSIFIYLFVQDELSYDKYIPGYEDVFRLQADVITGTEINKWASSQGFVVPTIAETYPEIKAAARILQIPNDLLFKTDSAEFAENNVWAVDTTFFAVFPISFVYGDPVTALDRPFNIVISKTVAEKFFGNMNPIGKILTRDSIAYNIAGVMEDMPATSHFHANVVFPIRPFWPDVDAIRNMLPLYSYVRAGTGQGESLATKLRTDWAKISGIDVSNNTDTHIEINTTPLSEIHLSSRIEREIEPNGNKQIVHVFIGAALLILLIASINYINLSNALATKRAKEISVRKAIGATRAGLFGRFLLETYLFTFLSFAISLLTVALAMPWFNTLTGKELSSIILVSGMFPAMALTVWMSLGFLSGLYPAMLLSSYNPVQVLRSGFSSKSGKMSVHLTRSLIIFQFAVSAMMIVCSLTIRSQMKFIENLDIGFTKENVLVLRLSGDARDKVQTLKLEIEKLKEVVSTSAMSVVPGTRVPVKSIKIPGLAGTQPDSEGNDDGSRSIRTLVGDHDVIKTLGIQIMEGRDFSDVGDGDREHAFILNEAAVKAFDLKDPVGKPFEYTFRDYPRSGQIIAVVKDFNFASVHSTVEPLMIHITPGYAVLCVRLETKNIHESIAAIESSWKRVCSAPVNYSFLYSTYDALYKSDKATGKIVNYFTVLAIVIACLGLFGVISFVARQRVKEVAVRKVFGASVNSLLGYLSKEYVIMVLFGNLLAIYPTWVIVDNWLQQFAYRIEFSPIVFIITLGASATLAFGSMVYILLRVARTNPAVVLKSE
ncbi:MAG TPA: FtsX-like permease family protein [Chryseolinea sp.]|nr:FtsX-like permease family protein [Chryseolinea sp.]